MSILRPLALIIALYLLCCPALHEAAVAGPLAAEAPMCSYTVSVWNVRSKSISSTRRVSHPYSELGPEEIEPLSGCTVCEEDQSEISLHGLSSPFMVCNKLAPALRDTLLQLIEQGHMIEQVRGYKVVRSRGPVDAEGNRTVLSNHSYGTAIDINRHLNGLYTDCVAFGPGCRLLLGGRWSPGNPGVLTPEGPMVTAMKDMGFLWGGEIKGRQKDFMHFSLTGY